MTSQEDNLFMIEYVKCYSEGKEYLELFDSPANGFGQHVHPMYGQSHLMLRYLYNKYGDKAVRMEIDNQLRNRRCRILSKG